MAGLTCPLCDDETTFTRGGYRCSRCELEGPISALSAVARLRVQARQRNAVNVDAYRERNRVIAALAALAIRHGLRAGLGRHAPDPDPTWDPSWLHVVYIELPEGQVSWHVPDRDLFLFADLPPYDRPWDGHRTEDRHRRLSMTGSEP